jgi:O-antigen/teichoic acid export membrane protein
MVNRLPRSSFVLVGSVIGASLIGVVTALLLPFVLDPRQYAIFSLMIAFSQLCTNVSNEWLRISAIRFAGGKVRGPNAGLILALYQRLSVILLAVGLAMFALSFAFPALCFGSVLVIAALFQGAFDGRSAFARARFQNIRLGMVSIVRAIFGLVGAIGVAYLTGSGLWAFMGLILSYPLAMPAFGDNPARLLAPRRLEWVQVRSVMRLGLFAALASNAALVVPALLRGMIASIAGLSGAGPALLAFDVAQRLFAVLGTSLNLLTIQVLIRTADTRPREDVLDQSRMFSIRVSAVFLWVAACGATVADPIAELVVPPGYAAGFATMCYFMLPIAALLYLRQYAFDSVFIVFRRTGLAPIAPAAVTAALAIVYLAAYLGSVGLTTALWLSLGIATAGALATGLVLRYAGLPALAWREIALTAAIAAASGFGAITMPGPGAMLGLVLRPLVASLFFLLIMGILDIGSLRSRFLIMFSQWIPIGQDNGRQDS